MHYLALCCIARDEDLFLKEWLSYHALLGVEHFYIFDNMSRTPIRDVLGSFADKRDVTVIDIEGQGVQMSAYRICLREFGPSCHWIGFFDLDEFVLPMQDRDLRVLLAEYEQYGGLAVNWDIFSSSGHVTRPEGLVVKNYTQRVSDFYAAVNVHIKCFVRPPKVTEVLNPHVFAYAPGEVCVSSEHTPLPGPTAFAYSSKRKIRLNHYYYRSQQDYEEKVNKGRADVDGERGKRRMDPFFRQAQFRVTNDTKIWRFLPGLKKAMAGGALSVRRCPLPPDAPLDRCLRTVQDLLDRGQTDMAAVCLCHAVMAYGDDAALWVKRAEVARMAGMLDRAERFLVKAMSLEESLPALRELKALRLAQNRPEEAQDVGTYIVHRLKARVG